MKGQHLVVAVEDNEKEKISVPVLMLGQPHFKGMPLMGEFRGNAGELILGLNLPQVIFKPTRMMEFQPMY